MSSTLHRLLGVLASREDGQTMAEYGVALTVITLAIVAVFAALGDDIGGTLNAVRAALPG
jgi:Flp pilus assembly pilin Flp